MKHLFIIPLLFTLSAVAQQLTPQEIKLLQSVEPATTISFKSSDSPAMRVAKTAMVVPTPQQLAWQQYEYTCFIHFGPNTFTGREWGNGMEDPSVFNPSKVDTDQWCEVAKKAGMKLMVITVKHHDGYCTWQTRYNKEFSVHQSPWKQGKGDVLRLLSESCKKYGLKLGVYLSPADLYQIENKEGLYGNRSSYRKSAIPTSPEHFKTDPSRGRKAPEGKLAFTYEVDDYNRLMLNQLYELLTEYGEIHEVWFDGAHPKRKGGQKYTETLWYEMIRVLAPNAAIFGGPDIRWCGNEAGHTRSSEWSPIPIQGDPTLRSVWKIGWGNDDLGSRDLIHSYGDFAHWFPSEVDTSIRHGWFWRDENQHVRSAEEIYDIYEKAVGGNSVLLLNVPPNRDGVLGSRDTKTLLEVGKRIQSTYGRAAAGLMLQQDGVYVFDAPATINRCVLMEEVATHGQRVEKHALDAWIDGDWKEVTTSTVIGYKRILRFPDVTTDKIRIRILEQRLTAKISHASVHYDRAPLRTPEIVRDRAGAVTLKGRGSLYYTLDGSTPTTASDKYTGAFDLPKGGTVKAVAIRDEETSEVTTTRFDVAKAKWKIHHVSSQNPSSGEGAGMAIDGDPSTLWHSKWSGGEDRMPHSITIDLGEELDLNGFSYLPRKRPERGGILDEYKVELSRDGNKWITASGGRFDNINNDPTQRDVRFSRTYPRTRYLRLTGIHSIENKPHSSAAEIGVITR